MLLMSVAICFAEVVFCEIEKLFIVVLAPAVECAQWHTNNLER